MLLHITPGCTSMWSDPFLDLSGIYWGSPQGKSRSKLQSFIQHGHRHLYPIKTITIEIIWTKAILWTKLATEIHTRGTNTSVCFARWIGFISWFIGSRLVQRRLYFFFPLILPTKERARKWNYCAVQWSYIWDERMECRLNIGTWPRRKARWTPPLAAKDCL